MAREKSSGRRNKDYDPSRYKVEEMWGTVSESKNSNWGKYVFKGRFDDNPSTIDIRFLKRMGDGDDFIAGKGISLTDEEVDSVVNTLVQRGYGSVSVFNEEKRRRKKLYGFPVDENEEDDDFDGLELDIF